MPDNQSIIKWTKENTTRIAVRLNNHTDKDILEKLKTVPNKQGYIKQLIREDINMNG